MQLRLVTSVEPDTRVASKRSRQQLATLRGPATVFAAILLLLVFDGNCACAGTGVEGLVSPVIHAAVLQNQQNQQNQTEESGEQQESQEAGEGEKQSAKEPELDEVARQGIPRPPLPAFQMLRSAPSLLQRDEIPRADELRRFRQILAAPGNLSDEDRELVRRCVRYYVLRLSDPSEFGRRRRNLQELADVIRRARANSAVYPDVRDVVLKATEQMFRHHIVSRVSAGIVLQLLADEEAIPLLVAQIESAEQHESVKIWCIKAIAAIALHDPSIRIRNKSYEDRALRTLLEYFRSDPPPHYWTQREIIRALGAIGRPTEDLLNRDANVAREIVLFLRGQNLRAPEGSVPEGPGRLVRVEAVDALTLLVIPSELEYNYQQVGAEITRFAVEAAFAALRDPLIDRLNSYLYVRRCYDALLYFAGDPSAADPALRNGAAARHPFASSQGDPAYLQALRDKVKALNEEIFRVFRPSDREEVPEDLVERARWFRDRLKNSNVEALARAALDFLGEHPPRDFGKLTPTTPPLPPWPELKPPAAEAAAAAAPSESEGGATTDGTATP